MTQANVYHYEVRGQTVMPDVAERLIAVAAERGLVISYDHIYGQQELPQSAAPEVVSVQAAT
jgi:putative transcriptional regulator